VNIVELEPVGAIVSGPPLSRVDEDTIGEFQWLLAEHGMVVFSGQHLDDEQFVAFLTMFGDLMFTTGETPVPDREDLNVVSNVGRARPKSTFHTDTSYVQYPPAYTALRAVQLPARGGDTLFTNQYRAHDTLPSPLRRQLVGRTLTHVVSGLELADDDETTADHPVLEVHPISRRTALYLTAPQRCGAISGLDAVEAAELVDRLFAHSTASHNVGRHRWSDGDIVMWDNRCVLHRADHSNVVGDRVMHRGMVAAPLG